MSASCALCGGTDVLDAGVCSGCTPVHRRDHLVFVSAALRRTSDPEARAVRAAARESVAMLSGSAPDPVEETLRRRRPLALVAAPQAPRITAALGIYGLDVKLLPRRAWHRALPGSFGIMLVAVLIVGGWSAAVGVTPLLLPSMLIAGLLLLGAARVLTTPLLTAADTRPLLPERARAALADSLGALPDGEPRTLLSAVARVGADTYAALPAAFRDAALGESVVELLAESSALADETQRLAALVSGLQGRAYSAPEALRLREMVQARLELLRQAVGVLGRVAQQTSDPQATRADEVALLVEQLRAETGYRNEAEATVRALTGG